MGRSNVQNTFFPTVIESYGGIPEISKSGIQKIAAVVGEASPNDPLAAKAAERAMLARAVTRVQSGNGAMFAAGIGMLLARSADRGEPPGSRRMSASFHHFDVRSNGPSALSSA